MECYVCHKLIKRHEYTRHIGSHCAGNDLGTRPRPSAPLPSFSYDTADYDHYEHDRPLRPVTPDDQVQSDDLLAQHVSPDGDQPAHFIPSRSPTRITEVSDRAFQQELSGGQSAQPNAFQMWLKNLAHDSPKYTIIDGQKSQPDSQEEALRHSAEVLRGTTKEEIVKIVNQFEGLPCSDRKTCLELVQKAPIFPGLVAYTYTHLFVCPRRRWFSTDDWSGRVSELRELVERWTKYSDKECILSYDTIKNRVFEILRATNVGPEEHKCNKALLNGAMVLKYDVLNLAALAALCITGSRKKDILDEHDVQNVGKLVELFHNLLEADVELQLALKEGYRRYFFNVLAMLSKRSGYCPRGIYIAKDTISGLVPESQGGFGIVYQGKVGSRLVAVKALKRGDHVNHVVLHEYKKHLSKEAIVWRHLRHPNCLPFHGIYTMTDGPNINYALVSPWMEQGTLTKYLEDNAKANRTKLILDVVRGLNYMHSMQPHVAHRDIKPENILITKEGHACLADFGLVSTFDTDDHFYTATSQVAMCGTLNYMAPEIFNAANKEAKRKVNKRACDMYALGCTIYAAYTGKHPFSGKSPALICHYVTSNLRPDFPEGKISPDTWSFIENLWGPDPLKRLTAQEALSWMEVKAHQEHVDTSLAPLQEEWEWKWPRDDESLWSMSL